MPPESPALPRPAGTSRRRFLSCAALAAGAAALARAQTPPAAPTSASPEVGKAVRETQLKETKARARQMTRYLKPLVAKYGPGVMDDIKATTEEGPRTRFEKMKLARRDLGTIKEQLWNNLDPEKYKVEKLEDTPTTLKFRVHTCPWAEAYREAKGEDIGFAVSCCWDYGFCQGVNPAIKFTRTKTLMQGDDCCNHSYELPAT